MPDENLTPTTLDHTSIDPSPLNNEDFQHHWGLVVKRRSFFESIGVAGAALSAGVALSSYAQATRRNTGRFPQGDSAALLRLGTAVELIEADPMQAKEYERRLDLEQEIQAFEEWQRNP
jgi:hypothetical protein